MIMTIDTYKLTEPLHKENLYFTCDPAFFHHHSPVRPPFSKMFSEIVFPMLDEFVWSLRANIRENESFFTESEWPPPLISYKMEIYLVSF